MPSALGVERRRQVSVCAQVIDSKDPWEQLGNRSAQTSGKTRKQGRPEGKMRQPLNVRRPCLQNLHPRFKSGRRLQISSSNSLVCATAAQTNVFELDYGGLQTTGRSTWRLPETADPERVDCSSPETGRRSREPPPSPSGPAVRHDRQPHDWTTTREPPAWFTVPREIGAFGQGWSDGRQRIGGILSYCYRAA
jgi:hypothetical protein